MSSRPYREPRQSPLAGRHPAIPTASGPPVTVPPPPPPSTPAAAPDKPTALANNGRTKVTYNIAAEVADLVRDAFWLDQAEYRSLSDWVEAALMLQVDATKAAHNLQALPRRPRPLRTGRPPS